MDTRMDKSRSSSRIGMFWGWWWSIGRVHSGISPCVPPVGRRESAGLLTRKGAPSVEGIILRLPSAQ